MKLVINWQKMIINSSGNGEAKDERTAQLNKIGVCK